MIGISITAGATWPAFQLGNESVSLALPLPEASGTRTGPWKCVPQQRCFSKNSALIVFVGSFLLGTMTSSVG